MIPADVFLAALRQRCENSFEYFARYFFKVRTGSPFEWAEHHGRICEALMAVHRGEHTNQRVHIPPRYSKTEMCVVLFVAWCYVKNPRCRFIHLSYADQLVQDNSQAIKDVIGSREFQQLWPHIQIRDNKDSKKAWDTVQGGTFYATSAGGQVTGFGAGRLDEIGPDGAFTFSGCLLIDDPLKPDDARHDTVREAINARWEGTIKSRRNSPRTPSLLIMQRIHERDFAAHVAADSSERWRSLELPALMDEGMPTERALWPAKHTVEKLKAMRDQRNDRGEVNPQARQVFDAQYQQRPTPAGGGTFKEAWWRYYGSAEAARARCTVLFMTADTAFTADQRNDASSVQLWGAEGRHRLYLLDRIHGRWEFPELLQRVHAFRAKHPGVKRLYVEAKASGLSLVQSLNRGRVQGAARAVPWKPRDFGFPDDKVGRAKLAATQVFHGRVWLPSPDIAPWVWEFVDEHSAFTLDDSHAHDDDVDGETMAVSIWTHQGGGRD